MRQTDVNSVVGASPWTLPVVDDVADARRYLAEYARWQAAHPGQAPTLAMHERKAQSTRLLREHYLTDSTVWREQA